MKSNTKRGDDMIHIVYVAKYLGEVMYVGEGLPNRHTHLISGVSHLYEANKFHFQGKKLEIDIVGYDLTKEQAITEETKLIEELNPRWNKVVPLSNNHTLSKGDRLKLLRYFNRRFRDLGLVGCVGYELLKLILGKVNGFGYAELTGKVIRDLTGGKVNNKYPTYLLESSEYRQYKYMDEFLIVSKPYEGSNIRGYQFTPEVMARIGKSDILTKE